MKGKIFVLMSFLLVFFMLSTVSASTIYVGESGNYTSIQDAINVAISGDVVEIAEGTYEVTSQLNINKNISLVGDGEVTIIANNSSWPYGSGVNDSIKHLLDIGGNLETPVIISNIIFDSNNQASGVQVYVSNATFDNVEFRNSKGAGLTVNGATVEATNLITSGNSWGAVNVDIGSGVTSSAVFTLDAGDLSEDNQIWSDGDHVTENVTVTVYANGYDEYVIAENGVRFWLNKKLSNFAVIDGEDGVVYSLIQDAIDNANENDVVEVYSGTYDETIIVNTDNLTIKAADEESPIIQPESVSGFWLIVLNANYTNINGLEIVGLGNTEKGAIQVNGVSTIIEDNTISDVLTGIQTATSEEIGDNQILNNNISNAQVGISLQNSNNVVKNNDIHTSSDTWEGIGIGSEKWAVVNNKVINNNIIVDEGVAVRVYNSTNGLGHVDGSSLDARNNYWGTSNETEIKDLISGNVSFTPWYSNQEMTKLSFGSPKDNGNGTFVREIEEELNLSNEEYNVSVQIPANVNISTDNVSWDGTISSPSVGVSATVKPSRSGFTTSVNRVVEVGSPGVKLVFDKAVKITIPDSAGKLVGYSYDGSSFNKITTVCTGNNESWNTEKLSEGGECYLNDGDDLVIWTKHFTEFVTYTETSVSTSSGGSSRHSSSSSDDDEENVTVLNESVVEENETVEENVSDEVEEVSFVDGAIENVRSVMTGAVTGVSENRGIAALSGACIVTLVIVLMFVFLGGLPGMHIRRARFYHRKAQRAHVGGSYGKAKKLYDKSYMFREKGENRSFGRN